MKKRDRTKKLAYTILIVALLPVGLLVQPAAADNTDFANFDWAAADAATYDHTTGGGAYNDGSASSVREELEATDFQCWDIVTFFTQVVVDAAPVDAVQTIDLSYSFSAGTTGQQGVAFTEIVSAMVNYGCVENGATLDGACAPLPGYDAGIVDDGGSTATLHAVSATGPLYDKDSLILGSVLLDDLEAGEEVIVRVDVRVGCDPDATSKPTGNLTGKLLDAFTVSPDPAAPQSIPGAGIQTIPFKQVSKIKPPPTAVDLASFTATADGNAILVEWETVSEVDNLGFNLYRAEAVAGVQARLNGDLILSRLPPGSPFGASYQFVDASATPGVTYYYRLEDVDVYGGGTFHGPVSAQLPGLSSWRLLPGRPRPLPIPAPGGPR